MSNIYTLEQLKVRGWTQEKVETLLGRPYKEIHEIKVNHEKKEVEKIGWNKKQIRKIEKYPEYINFTTAQAYQTKKTNLEDSQIENTIEAVAKFKQNYPKPQSSLLQDNLDKHKTPNGLVSEIIQIHPDIKINSEMRYEMFTDGCLKVVGNVTFISCAGWIRSSNGKVLVEFAKELDKSYFEGNHNFEIYGIATGFEIAKSIGIKHLDCYTDSSAEVKTLSFGAAGFSQDRILELPNVYQPILKNISELNATVCYIPREYNSHADMLTKTHMVNYQNRENILKNQQKELAQKNQFNYDYSDNHTYFYHNKAQKAEYGSSQWCLASYIPDRDYHNFLINTQTNEIHFLSKNSVKSLIKNMPDTEGKNIQASSMEVQSLLNLNSCLDKIHEMGIKDLTIRPITPGFNVIVENMIPIKNMLKPQIYKFHEKLNHFDNIYFSQVPDEVLKNMKQLTKNNTQNIKPL